MTAKETTVDARHHVVAAMFDRRPIALTAVGELRAAGFTDVELSHSPPTEASDRFWGEVRRSFGAEAHGVYAEGARRGAIVVVVECGQRCDLAASILEKNVPVDIDERARDWGLARDAAPTEKKRRHLRVVRPTRSVAETIAAIDVLALDLEVDYGKHATPEMSFDQFKPAWEYGQRLASADARGWDAIEDRARGRFERKNPGAWDTYRDVVRRGYERALARR